MWGPDTPSAPSTEFPDPPAPSLVALSHPKTASSPCCPVARRGEEFGNTALNEGPALLLRRPRLQMLAGRRSWQAFPFPPSDSSSGPGPVQACGYALSLCVLGTEVTKTVGRACIPGSQYFESRHLSKRLKAKGQQQVLGGVTLLPGDTEDERFPGPRRQMNRLGTAPPLPCHAPSTGTPTPNLSPAPYTPCWSLNTGP